MKIAQELGKSVEEVYQFSVLEIQLWASWFKMLGEEKRKVMNDGKHRPRRSRHR
jgi:hypothetical protein